MSNDKHNAAMQNLLLVFCSDQAIHGMLYFWECALAWRASGQTQLLLPNRAVMKATTAKCYTRCFSSVGSGLTWWKWNRVITFQECDSSSMHIHNQRGDLPIQERNILKQQRHYYMLYSHISWKTFFLHTLSGFTVHQSRSDITPAKNDNLQGKIDTSIFNRKGKYRVNKRQRLMGKYCCTAVQ